MCLCVWGGVSQFPKSSHDEQDPHSLPCPPPTPPTTCILKTVRRQVGRRVAEAAQSVATLAGPCCSLEARAGWGGQSTRVTNLVQSLS